MKHIAVLLMLVGVVMAQDAITPKTAAKPKLDPAMKAEVDGLVAKLGDEKYKVRKAAKAELKKMGKSVSPYLEPYLTDKDIEVRETVKELLAEVDPFRGLEPDKSVPRYARMRALLKGDKPKTVGEKVWLDRQQKQGMADDTRVRVEMEARARRAAMMEKMLAERAAMEAALAKKRAEKEKIKALMAKRAAEEAKKRAELERRKAEEEKKRLEEEKKKAENQ